MGKEISFDNIREWVRNAKEISTILNREIFMGGWKDEKSNDYYLDNTIIFDNKEETLYVGDLYGSKSHFSH